MTTDPTPIPGDPYGEIAIAAVVTALSRFEQPPYDDLQCSAARAAIVAIDAAAPILLAAGHTEGIPGWVHEQTVTFDGDTYWLACDFCDGSVHPIDAGDSLETIVTKARDHRRTCAGGGDRG